MERSRPQPADVLRVCKNQVAKLELWLQQASVAFEPETVDTDMQQVVEEELAGCQVRLAGRNKGLPSHQPPAKVGQRALKAAGCSSQGSKATHRVPSESLKFCV